MLLLILLDRLLTMNLTRRFLLIRSTTFAQQIANLRATIAQLLQANQQLQHQNDQLQDTILELQEENYDLHQSKVELLLEVCDLTNERIDLRSQVAELTRERNDLQYNFQYVRHRLFRLTGTRISDDELM